MASSHHQNARTQEVGNAESNARKAIIHNMTEEKQSKHPCGQSLWVWAWRRTKCVFTHHQFRSLGTPGIGSRIRGIDPETSNVPKTRKEKCNTEEMRRTKWKKNYWDRRPAVDFGGDLRKEMKIKKVKKIKQTRKEGTMQGQRRNLPKNGSCPFCVPEKDVYLYSPSSHRKIAGRGFLGRGEESNR